MSLLPLLTSANKTQSLWAPYFSTAALNASTISTGTLIADSISTNKLFASTAQISSLEADYISTNLLFADAGTISTFSTFEIVLDSQTLNANATELLLNGVPIATTANLSSIADWAVFPAVSTVQMQGNDLNNAGTVSSVNVRAANGFFTNLMAVNAFFISTATSTLSTSINVADLGLYSSINANNVITSTLTADSAGISTLGVSSMTANSIGAQYLTLSSLTAADSLSTPSLYVSSINGSEFTSTGITVQVAGVSSLVANSISSIGAELRTALVSTLQFNPSFSPTFQPNVNLGLGSILGNVIGWGAGVFGAAAGTVGLATGIAALAMGRQQDFIDNSRYELVSGTTQLQFSTLGETISSIYRFNDSASPDQIPGSTLYVSTLIPAGTVAVRSFSDPINTVSTPNSTIQAFGQWVAVPPELAASTFQTLATSSLAASSIQVLDASVSSVVGLSSINGIPIGLYENTSSFEWAIFPAISTINFSTGTAAVISSANPATDNIALVGSDIQLIGAFTDAKNLLLASTISTAQILGAADNLFGVGLPGLKIDAQNLFFSTVQTNITGLTNCSTLGALTVQARAGGFSTLAVSSLAFNSAGLSSLMFLSSPATAVTGANSTLTVLNTDLTLNQNDLYAAQIRLGLGAADGLAPEILMYGSDGSQRTLGSARGDRTIRTFNTALGSVNGYLFDTFNNPPFFSTINSGTSTALFAYFPSSLQSTIGVSTVSVIPNPIFVAAANSLSSQKVLAANTPLALDLGTSLVNVGGFTLAASTLTVPVAGTYQFSPSLQFNTSSGSANTVDFWMTKNGADLQNSASRVTVANNAENLGTVVIYDTAAAGDKYGIKMASADANMTAGFFQSTISPYARPAIPSIILNAQRIA